LNFFFEFFFLYLLAYLLLHFTYVKYNNIYFIILNFYPNNYIYFIYLLIFNNKFKNLKKISKTNLKYHIIFIIFFIVVYFLKIYLLSTSIFLEYYFISKNSNTLYNHNSFSTIFYNINSNFFINEYIYTNIKFFNFSEIKLHYYKNFLINLNSFFIKILHPNENVFLLIYKNLFLLFIVLYPFIFINKFFKNININ